jgi:hypothetical protein
MQSQAQSMMITENEFVDMLEKSGPKTWREIQEMLKKHGYVGGDIRTEQDLMDLVAEGLLVCSRQLVPKKHRKRLEQIHGAGGASSFRVMVYSAAERK